MPEKLRPVCPSGGKPVISSDLVNLSTSLIEALLEPGCYPHPAGDLQVLQTHASWVILAGDYAYKIKKPVDLGFLDFSTLSARKHFCQEEIRLNRRLAPNLYLGTVPVLGTLASPNLRGASAQNQSEPLEYAVRMKRFDPLNVLGALADRNQLDPSVLTRLARRIARFHRESAVAGPNDRWGEGEAILDPAIANFEQIGNLRAGAQLHDRLEKLRLWTEREYARLEPSFKARKDRGFIRECHGDLHLANIALIDGEPVPFDALEFDPALRWIDTVSEIAFTVMDLHQRGLPGQAWMFLDEYLASTGDYDGVRLLPFYLVYRSMVRAKIAAISESHTEDISERALHTEALLTLLELAEHFAAPPRPWLVLTHGVSGCGKSETSARLLQLGGWIRLRSDVERKRLAGLAPQQSSSSSLQGGLYVPQMSDRTYAHLRQLADALLQAGQAVIVDASFLQHGQRASFIKLAKRLQTGISILAPWAPVSTLHERIASRLAKGADPSEADAAVLENQLASMEALDTQEQQLAQSFDSRDPQAADHALQHIERVRRGPKP